MATGVAVEREAGFISKKKESEAGGVTVAPGRAGSSVLSQVASGAATGSHCPSHVSHQFCFYFGAHAAARETPPAIACID